MLALILLGCVPAGDETGDSASCAEQTWFYYDADGDGYGNVDESAEACAAPPGYREAYGDCDDLDPHKSPVATESCNGADDDCDGQTDEDASDAATWYPDSDGDGYGVAEGSVVSCEAPAGFVDNDDDIDDSRSDAYPGAVETCDGIDNDGDGQADESGAEGEVDFYLDADADGHGDPAASIASCEEPPGYTPTGDDCDDADASIYPGAAEVDCADPVDRNCDGSVGFADADADGYAACEECNDADPGANPAATETCDGADNDCDGDADEDASDASTWYPDADGDGHGGTTAVQDCEGGGGLVAVGDDCDDSDESISPSSSETCNGVDDDCDGVVDDDALDGVITWIDADGDGYGDPAAATADCDGGGAGVTNGDDCDDSAYWVSPAGAESCNGVDDDCDGDVDESGATGETTFYADHDSDGYGDASTVASACSAPVGHVADATDCDDYDSSTSPGSSESCDGEDDDCDGEVDEGEASDAPTWYLDVDGDGFGGVSATQVACDAPSGHVATGDDCDDNDPFAYPGADEICDGKVTDCDDAAWSTDAGIVSFYANTDASWSDWTGLFATGTSTSPVTIEIEEGGQLNVCPGTWYVSVEVDGGLSVGIEGPEGSASTILDGAGQVRVLSLGGSSGAYDLGGLTVRNGYAADGGGLRTSDGYSTFSLHDMVFEDNEAFDEGGAAYLGNQTDVYELDGVTFSRNSAGNRGGAICIGCGGGGYSTLVLDGVIFEDNSANYGGVLYTLYDVDIVANDVSASGNDATAGGGVFAIANTSSLVLDNSELFDNEAANGGALWLFTSGSAQLDGTSLHDNVAYGAGGAIYSSTSSGGNALWLTNTAVFDNVSYGAGGGAYLAYATAYCAGSSASDEYGVFGNTAIGGNGDDIHSTSYTTLYVSSCDIGDARDATSGEVYSGYSALDYAYGLDADFTCDTTGCY